MVDVNGESGTEPTVSGTQASGVPDSGALFSGLDVDEASATPKTAPDTPGEDGATKEADGNNAETPEPEKARPEYTLTPPEGYPLQDAALQEFTGVCQTAGLDKAQAEAVMAYMAGNYAAWQDNQLQTRKAWDKEIRADKEFGGDRYAISVAEAKKALARFDEGYALRRMLRETGYGDNPEVLRILARVGAALGDDTLVGSGGGGAARPLEERIYPNM